MQQKNITKINAIPCEYKGRRYDCLQEAKFIIQIENSFSYIREPVRIYYDKATLMPTCTLGYNPPYYKPDLLIRGWNDHRAFLIEIKADEEKHSEKTIRNEKVARNYILQQGFDWEYKLILYSEIQSAMTKEQTIIFMRDVREAADLHAFKRRSEKLDRRFRKGEVSYKRKLTYFIDGREVTEAENNNFVKRAILPDSFD